MSASLIGFSLYIGKINPSQSRVIETSTNSEPVKLQKADIYKIYDHVNNERVRKDLKPLKFNQIMCEYAEQRLENMKTEYSHKGFRSTSREALNKYNLSYLGENLSEDIIDDSNWMVVDAWMASESHRKNILDKNYTDTCVRCDDNYCVQIFAGF